MYYRDRRALFIFRLIRIIMQRKMLGRGQQFSDDDRERPLSMQTPGSIPLRPLPPPPSPDSMTSSNQATVDDTESERQQSSDGSDVEVNETSESPKRCHVIDEEGTDKGIWFNTLLIRKAESLYVNGSPKNLKWYHGFLHRWIIVPWRKLWSPRV